MILSGILIKNFEGKFLLLYRKGYEHYETPGGKLEEGENLKEAAIREFNEELGGIEISEPEFLASVEFEIEGEKAVANKFVANYIKGVPVIKEDKFDRAEWIDLKKCDNLSPDLKILREKI